MCFVNRIRILLESVATLEEFNNEGSFVVDVDREGANVAIVWMKIFRKICIIYVS